MKKQILSEEFRKIQKLAGIITEAFNPFLDTEEGGYMREYIDMVAEEEELDLGYRSDFDMAFDSALIKANKESFF